MVSVILGMASAAVLWSPLEDAAAMAATAGGRCMRTGKLEGRVVVVES